MSSPLRAEERVRPNLDLDQCVAGLTPRPRRALAFQAQHLPVRHALGDGDVEHAAVRHGHPLLGAGSGLQEVDFQRVAHVAAAGTKRAVALAPPGPATAEQVRKDIAEAEILVLPRPAGTAAERSPARIGALVAPARLAVGIDLAAIVLLALGRIADDVVGARDLLEALLRGGTIARIEVGMQLLGELAVLPANILVRRITRHTQHLVGVLGHLASPSRPAT